MTNITTLNRTRLTATKQTRTFTMIETVFSSKRKQNPGVFKVLTHLKGSVYSKMFKNKHVKIWQVLNTKSTEGLKQENNLKQCVQVLGGEESLSLKSTVSSSKKHMITGRVCRKIVIFHSNLTLLWFHCSARLHVKC